MKKQTIIMDFSGIYREESFFENREVCWLDCRDISGVNGYCSDDAQEEIRKRIQEYSYEGIMTWLCYSLARTFCSFWS